MFAKSSLLALAAVVGSVLVGCGTTGFYGTGVIRSAATNPKPAEPEAISGRSRANEPAKSTTPTPVPRLPISRLSRELRNSAISSMVPDSGLRDAEAKRNSANSSKAPDSGLRDAEAKAKAMAAESTRLGAALRFEQKAAPKLPITPSSTPDAQVSEAWQRYTHAQSILKTTYVWTGI